MEAEVFTIGILSKDEAWSLFKEMAGDSVEAPDLFPVAKLVENECKCLPLALVTVGSSLKNKSKPVWKDALVQLKRAIPSAIPEVQRDLYLPLKLSYNRLESPEGRSLFLLCCLFREDFDIPLEDLVRYGMGLNFFGGIQLVEEARNRVFTLIEQLKDRFLLQDSDFKKHVKMHDVIRDVAISIASKDEHVFMISHDVNLKRWPRREACTAISIITDEVTELPGKCPRLELLRLVCKKCPLKVLDSFFAELSNLKVLDIDMQDNEIPSMPSSLGLLKNLRTLHLKNCESLKDITLIGELVNLEILSIVSSSINVLPKEIGRLGNLRLLELRDCFYLTTIAPGVISGLVELEELYMGSLEKFRWEAEEEGKESSNTILKELESLSNFTNLEISLPELELVPTSLGFWSKLTTYTICIGRPTSVVRRNDYQKFMEVSLPTITPLPDWTILLIKNSECLHLDFDGSKSVVNELDLDGFRHLLELEIRNCDTLEYIANTTERHSPSIGIFPILNLLCLTDMDNLTEVCHGQLPAGSFKELDEIDLYELPSLIHLWKGPTQNVFLGNLKRVVVNSCAKLGNLFLRSVARSLMQLQQLKISYCEMIQEVFSNERGDENVTDKIIFPKLERLVLRDLPSLICFCEDTDGIEFPLLTEIILSDLPMIMEFCPKSYHVATRLQPFFNQKFVSASLKELSIYGMENVSEIWCSQVPTGSFSKLEELRIFDCDNLRNLFSPSMARGLVHLRELKIIGCPMLEEVVVKEEEAEEGSRMNEIMFPQLEALELTRLLKLTSFFPVKHALELPSLHNVDLHSCPEMKTFSLGPLSTPKLENVSPLFNSGVWKDDLNNTIRHIYETEGRGRKLIAQLESTSKEA